MTYTFLKDPSPEEFADFLRSALRKRRMVQAASLCTVEYKGRAESMLEKGERLVIAKKDGAFLVHGPTGYRPKNWQPKTDQFRVREGDPVVLEAKRSSPREVVRVTFHEVSYAVATHLVDDEQLTLMGTERQVQEALRRRPDAIEEGLRRVKREVRTDAGDIDLFAQDGEGNVVVVEVKRNPGFESAEQLDRYVREVKESYGDRVRGVLAAPSISSRLDGYLEKLDLEGAELDFEELTEDVTSIEFEQSSINAFKD